MLLVMWLVVTLAFATLWLLPGDAIEAQLLIGGATEEQIEARRESLGLDDPAPIRYLRYLSGLLHGDMGRSLLTGQPVTQIIAQQAGATLELATASLVVATVLGLGLGLLSAGADGSVAGSAAKWITSLALSTPIYWTGIIAIWLFSVVLGWLPAIGSGDLRHLVLPAGVLGFHVAGSIARVTGAGLIEAKSGDFVTVARAKGLRADALWLRHILRVGLLPVITIVALQLGFLLGGTVITETLFVRRGIGRLLMDAILDRDLPVVQGVVVLGAITYSVTNALADLLYALADPRLRVDG